MFKLNNCAQSIQAGTSRPILSVKDWHFCVTYTPTVGHYIDEEIVTFLLLYKLNALRGFVWTNNDTLLFKDSELATAINCPISFQVKQRLYTVCIITEL